MNILIINWRDIKNPLYGGAEIHITHIAECLAKNNNVYFISSLFENAQKQECINNVHYIRMGNEFLFNFYVMKNIKAIVKTYNIDLIIEDINKIPFYTPLFVNKKTLVVIPHIFGNTIFKQTNFVFASYVYLSEKFIKKVYNKCIFEVISLSTKKDLIKRSIDKKSIKVIECGIDNTFIHFKEKYNKFQNPVIVYIGRLKKYKSIEHAIFAIDKLKHTYPNIKLIIAGRGDYEDNLKTIVNKLNLNEFIEFRGYISEEEKWKLLRQSWISIYPSLIEGWGIVNIEANLMGTPVVCANVPGLRDSVKDNYSGLLYQYGNIDDCTNKIINIIKNRERFYINASNWAKLFSWERTCTLTKQLINKYL